MVVRRGLEIMEQVSSGVFSLWYRFDRKHQWERVASGLTYSGAVELIAYNPRRHGWWWIGEGERQP